MKKINIILLTALIALPFAAQSQSGRLKYANKMYLKQAYYNASQGYEDVIARKTDSSTVAVRIADSYDKIGNTEKAIAWYNFINRKNALNKDQHLRLVLLERELENYKGSSKLLASYKEKYGEENLSNDLISGLSVEDLKKDKNQFVLKLQDVNTSQSEIGTSYISDNEVLLSSTNRKSKASKYVQSWSGNYFYDIYRAPINSNGNIGKMKIMKSDAKTKYNDGPAVYNAQTKFVYFTRNNLVDGKKGTDKNNAILLKIFKAKMDGNKFTDVEQLSINSDNYSNAHPTVSEDGRTLYFSSNRPGGYGGMDIYSVELNKEGKSVGTPKNLGDKVNTSQNEVFPHYDSRENILFFSSDGHFGLGGLDVYVAKLMKGDKVNSIENLGAPINSPHDDFSFVNDSKQTKGYFSSNRVGGQGDDDVYGFNQNFPIRNSAILNGIVNNLKTKSGLANTTIYLVNKEGVTLDSTTTNSDGSFEIFLSSIEDDFKITSKKEGFITAEKEIGFDASKDEYETEINLAPDLDYHFIGLVRNKKTGEPIDGVKITIIDNNTNKEFTQSSTDGSGNFKTTTLPYMFSDKINYNFIIEKKGYVTNNLDFSDVLDMVEDINVSNKMSIDLTEIEVGKTDLNEVVEISPIYFDFGKYDIRPDAAVELNKVVKVMKDNPGMVIELGSHTDSRGSASTNQRLSDKRAKASAEYIITQGIERNRISGKGYGKSRLKISDAEIAKAKTEQEKEDLHEKNRRTEFIIVKMD